MFQKVLNSRMQQIRRVTEHAQGGIAFAAQKAANGVRFMAMVNAQMIAVWLLPANSTDAVLLGKYLLVTLKRNTKLAFEFSGSHKLAGLSALLIFASPLANSFLAFFALTIVPSVARMTDFAVTLQAVLCSTASVKIGSWFNRLTLRAKLFSVGHGWANFIHIARRFHAVNASRLQKAFISIAKPKGRSRQRPLALGTFFEFYRHRSFGF